MKKLLLFFIVCLFTKCELSLSKKLVTTSLETQWKHTSLFAETSEFIAGEDSKSFWNYLEESIKYVNQNNWTSRTHKQEYDGAIKVASLVLNTGQIKMLKLALSLRLFSPRIQVFQQIASELPESLNCATFVDVQGQITCNVNEIENFLNNFDINKKLETYSIDHVHKNVSLNLPIAILYADMDSIETNDFHKQLKKLSNKNRVMYIFRHYKKDQESDVAVGLSGYGVELAIKNTEYKAIDDSNKLNDEVDQAANSNIMGVNFNTLNSKYPNLKESLNQFKKYLLDMEELTPLKQWEVADLSFQAAQSIINADPTDAISTLVDLSQNFPIRSRSLVQIKVNNALRNEVIQNQEILQREYSISEGENAFFLNGINIDVDSLDIFQLFNTISKEQNLAAAFFGMGFRTEYLSVLSKIDLSEEKTNYAVDYRSAYPDYINDLDKDKSYERWGNSVKLLLQPFFPKIARNLFTLICVIDPSKPESRSLLKNAHSFYVHHFPLRIGFVFVVDEDKSKNGLNNVGIALLNFYNYAKTEKNAAKAIDLLTTLLDTYEKDLTLPNIHKFFKKYFKDEEVNEVFGEDSHYDHGRWTGSAFLRQSGLQITPKVLLNGIVLDDASIQPDQIADAILLQLMKQTSTLQKAVMKGLLTDRESDVQNWIMDQPEVFPRVNNRLLKEPTGYLALHNVNPCKTKELKEFVKLDSGQRAECILENSRYLTKTDSEDTKWLTVWLVGDFDTFKGRNLLRSGLKALKKSAFLRLSILHNGKRSSEITDAKVIETIFKLYSSNVAKQMLNKFLGTSLEKPDSKLNFAQKLLKNDYKNIEISGANLVALKDELESSKTSEITKIRDDFVKKDLNLGESNTTVIVNGLIYGPLEPNENFIEDDFLLLTKIFDKKGAKALAKQIDEWMVSKENGKSSDVVMRSFAVIEKYAIKKKRQFIEPLDDLESVINIISQDGSLPIIDVTAVIDPLSRNAQKLAPVIQILLKVINCNLRLILNPKSKLSELPLKRFYRYVLNEELQFNEGGRILTNSISFNDLPSKQLLTLNLISPDSWMVQPVYAEYDLDNIKMITTKKDVVAKFELIHILLEGHCFDEATNNPPRGLQYILGTKSEPSRFDTIVMANLGYFQLKAYPGAWILQLREGKSRSIYEIKSAVDSEKQDNEKVVVLVDSFLGKTIRIRVIKRPGMEEHSILDDSTSDEQDSFSSFFNTESDDSESGSIWSSISNKLKGGESYDKINIFSLASGHLYERFLRIMMLSVVKNTKHLVKFWLLNNYLSPHFRKLIPEMAKKYNFEYKLIEYKWPRWLHQQTEKNRIMWGYKILFLDVLFPLDVKKIIFVDADQVVRTDMMELMNLDLGGAPYAYTPFCDSRTSMDGFRFWKQGYWSTHLAGRKYHISALYVVDLVKFRQIAAGDRLRGQYQGLSNDPNSLSNLDQDLPNNMIHQVRIKSLPQDWLWCETWCSDESKKNAKTIDLCNNPLTKEPKLESAMRIIPEWNEYDAELKQFLDKDFKTVNENIENKPEIYTHQNDEL